MKERNKAIPAVKDNFILFDFDGVIADSFAPAFEIQKMICPALDEDSYRRRFEGNINDWEDPINTHTAECRHDIDFFVEYIPRMRNEVQIKPGMTEVITQLGKEYTLVMISSTITSPIQEFMEKHNLASHFVEIMGNDVHTSKVEKIKTVFGRYGTSAGNCLFITDTLGDMREADKMGVGTIGVTWGFHASETLQRGGPFCLVGEPQFLPNAVADYFANTSR